ATEPAPSVRRPTSPGELVLERWPSVTSTGMENPISWWPTTAPIRGRSCSDAATAAARPRPTSPPALVPFHERYTICMGTVTATAPIAPTDDALTFACANPETASTLVGINTLLLSASAAAVPDIVALAATLSGDGIVNVPGTGGTGVFAVATVNVGATAPITVSADTGSASLPIAVSICQTNPATGACLAPASPTVTTTINANATP